MFDQDVFASLTAVSLESGQLVVIDCQLKISLDERRKRGRRR
jgi:hypothetical protein